MVQAKVRSQLKAFPPPTAFVLVGDVCFETKTDVDPPSTRHRPEGMGN